jgi:Lipopolysaccharide-assembly
MVIPMKKPNSVCGSKSLFMVLFASLIGFVCPACMQDGHLNILRYTTKTNFDSNIRTVRVPLFKNSTFTPGGGAGQGLENELTLAVIREIESKTPYKVVNGNAPADTELSGSIVNFSKNIINRNQLNEIREAETNLAVQIIWKDLRTGEILSRPRADLNKGTPVALGGDPNVQPDTTPVLVTSLTSFIPELGQSITSARKTNVDVLATQIVAMMEIPW